MAELHPFFVHFPIALLMAAAPFDIFAKIRQQKEYFRTAYLLQLLAGISAILAAVSGNMAETVVNNQDALSQSVTLHLDRHISIGNAAVWIIIMVVVGRTFAILEKKAWADQGWIFPVISTALALLVLITGLLGGELSREILQYFISR